MVALIGILLLLLLSGARRALPYFFLLAFMAFSFFVASYEGLRLPKVRQDDVSLESTLKVSERQEAWHAAWALIRKRPFLGYGFGTGDEIFAYFKISFKHHQGAYVHNSYLQFWLETGIIGLMIMLGILLLFAREGLRNLRRASEERTRMIAGLLFAFFAASCIHASIESWMISPGSVHTAIFWLMASAMLKIGQSIEGEEAVSA
ncbi:MAG: O-antigen ligase domain-containing protein [Deltaproteobacteria bacterium]|nr:MAG: O-antigen ligase domain-containing protein [Deltaproteobacteria bacterium]